MTVVAGVTSHHCRFKVKQDGVTRSAANMLAYPNITLPEIKKVMEEKGNPAGTTRAVRCPLP